MLTTNADDEESLKRFRKEARILATLDHPNIVKVLGKRLKEPPYFYIMPLYKHSLRSELQNIIGDENRIYPIFQSILDAIEYAHEEGVIHRDLKPGNILMNDDHDLVVTDFGLGRILDTESTRITMTGDRIGTPWYMSPEQLLDAKCSDERSDIFSLGRILYEFYTGALMSSVQDASSLPSSIALIVERSTKNDPDERFQSVSEIKTLWQDFTDRSHYQSELEELLNLRTQLASSSQIEMEQASRLLRLMIKYESDNDLLHETFMQLSGNAIDAMYQADVHTLIRLVKRFVEFICSQGWPFSYTDKIGGQCRNIFYATDDYDIRAEMIFCTIEVGVSHNRWHVMKVSAELLQSVKDQDEAQIIARRIQMVSESTRRSLTDYLSLGKLPTAIRLLFAFDDSES